MKLFKNKTFQKILFTFVVILLVIPLQLGLNALKVREENIFLLFTVAIIIVLIETKNILYGIVTSFIFVLSFNFFDTEPLYSFMINDPNYYFSFFIFIVVSCIVGSLVLDLQKQNKKALESNEKVQAMYDLSSSLLDNHDKPYIFNLAINYFTKHMPYKFSIVDTSNNVYGEKIDTEYYKEMIQYCLDKNIPIGKTTFTYQNSNYILFPIRSKTNSYACLFVDLTDKNINEDTLEFIKKNILHLVVVLDRESILKERENIKVQVEKEKFKTSILRSLSHDLKTPLTSIKSGSDFILQSYDLLDDDTKKGIITDIYNDSCDLNTFIINLLNMTKLGEGKTLLNRKEEAIDEILSEVYAKTKRNLNGKNLEIKNSNDIYFVYADGSLLEQVFINLIDNAVKHTSPYTTIKINYNCDEDGVTFNVMDDGGGIKEENLNKIFEDFYSLSLKKDKYRSNGLGLSICRAIVEAHGGKITASNNDIGGATFTFNIPNKKGK